MSSTSVIDVPNATLRRRAGRVIAEATGIAPPSPAVRVCPLCTTIAQASSHPPPTLATCRTCGLVYRTTSLSVREVDYWSAYVDDPAERAYDARRQTFFRAYWRHVRRLARVRVDRPSVLDVGCVPGQLLREAIADGWDAHGIELSETLSALTRRSSAATVWTGRIEDIDFGGRRFDLIVLSNTFRHLDRPLMALRRCAAALRPRGVVVVREMQATHPRHAARLAAPYPCDMQFVTPVTMRTFMRRAGLADVRVFNSPVSLLTVRGLSRLAGPAPGLLGGTRRLVNLAIRCVDPFTAGRGAPLTPSFIMAGSRRPAGAGPSNAPPSPRQETIRERRCA
ncbi:MAG: class I SAM-dependent methyltransferase [Planctomycetota bacterium]